VGKLVQDGIFAYITNIPAVTGTLTNAANAVGSLGVPGPQDSETALLAIQSNAAEELYELATGGDS
jgi:hypothetical protein